MEILVLIFIYLVFTLPACSILSKKNRGAGYYILAFLWPLVGLIVAICLKKLVPEKREEASAPPTFDITEDNRKPSDGKELL